MKVIGDDTSVPLILIICDVTAQSVVIGQQAAADAAIGQWVGSVDTQWSVSRNMQISALSTQFSRLLL